MNVAPRLSWFAFAVLVAVTCARFSPAQAGAFDSLFGARTGRMPSLEGGTGWVNAPPVTREALRGKVVLVDFWTYSCINCLRTLPYVKAWADKYKDAGLVVIGVHTPEFGFERDNANVRKAVHHLDIGFPVVADGERRIWKAFGTQAWPTMVLVDAKGQEHSRQVGEGAYEDTERTIQRLLREAGGTKVPEGLVAPQGLGTQAAPGRERARSGETYLGAAQSHGFRATAGRLTAGAAGPFTPARNLSVNEWTLEGAWSVEAERVCLRQGSGRIAHKFSARDLHLVLGPAMDGEAIAMRVLLDGKAPAGDRGFDVDAQGRGTADVHRLYQLVRRSTSAGEQLFEIEFAKPGVCAYAFTFG
ncbi:redoxin family protein [Ramlibacter sp. PS3R-8]|uniref:redoxin family protein n=1 Tax=Ramlibacter sp. PS3R-8 TaxID=3133437 RepID=UPI0030A4C606